MNQEFLPKVLLVVAAHADDNEFCFGGSLAKWIKNGAEVHYLVVTDGQRGTPNADDDRQALIATRQAEQKAAADVLGVKSVECLTYEDGRMSPTWDLKRDIAKKIREVKPDTVLCMDPTFVYSSDFNYINHNDHRAVGMATFDAVYPLARDETAFEEIKDIPTHNVNNLLMYNLEKQHFFVDISESINQKIQAINQHVSQFSDMSKIEEVIKNFATQSAQKTDVSDCVEGFVKISID